MTISRTVAFEYAVPPNEVAALLQDPVFLRHRSETAGETNIDVRVEPESGGTRVTVSREKNVDVPAFAKPILGSARKATERTLWRASGETWLAEYTIEVGGVPVKAQGKSTLTPSPKGCKYASTFEITAKIPLIGKKIEELVAEGLVEQLLQNCQRNADGLARSTPRGPHSLIDGLSPKSDKAANNG
jgi:hypothetical protein